MLNKNENSPEEEVKRKKEQAKGLGGTEENREVLCLCPAREAQQAYSRLHRDVR
jgi:hypothetical protein